MNPIFNPAMLTLAREVRGLSQTQLSRESHVSQAHISKIEAGLIGASAEHAAAFARALKMPDRFFYQTDPVLGAGTSEFFHRKRQSVPAGVLNRIHAQVNWQRIHVARLLRSVEMNECTIPQLDLADFKGNPAEAARAVRSLLGIPKGPIQSMVKVIENAGGLVVPVAFGTYEVDALSRWVPGLPPLLFVNSTAPVDRFRMNLAHELAHMVLHRLPEQDMEPQADAFAAEFLMPAAEIRNQLHGINLSRLAALKPYWRTSMNSLLKRAGDLRCIAPGAARYLWIQLAKRGYRKREPAELDLSPEPPTLLKEIFDTYRVDFGYSIEHLAMLLVSTPDDLKSLYPVALTFAERVQQFRRVK